MPGFLSVALIVVAVVNKKKNARRLFASVIQRVSVLQIYFLSVRKAKSLEGIEEIKRGAS